MLSPVGEEPLPISTPRRGTAAVVVNGMIYILGGGVTVGHGRPVDLNEAYPPSRY
jgi:hypothetical protein